MKQFYVYELWDSFKNEPFYVGKGTLGSTCYRPIAHLRDALKKEKDLFKNRNYKDHKIRKIIRGGKKPLIKIVFNCFDEKRAFDKEVELIKKYGRKDQKKGPLVNHTDGGEGQSGHIAGKDERIKKSKAHLGSKNYMFGRKHNKKTRKLISFLKRNRVEVYYHTEAWKNKLKKSSLILRSLKAAKPIYQINFEGKIVKKWSSASAAANKLKIGSARIYTCARQNHRVCLGFFWIYVKDAKIKNGKIKNVEELNKKRLTHGSYAKFKRIDQYDLSGKFIKTWPSYTRAQEELGLDYSILSNIIRKKRGTNVYWGSIWKKPMKE